MTNTKFRKRALLSSVAMLLVALVALGSATFAWFVDDPTAVASGINAKAQTSTGLQIKTDTDPEWKHSATLAKSLSNITLAPATTSDFNTFWMTKAADASARDADPIADNGTDNRKWTSVTAGHVSDLEGVYAEKVYLRRSVTPGTLETFYVNLTDVTLQLAETTHAMQNGLTVQIRYTDPSDSTVKTLTYNSDGQPVGKYTTLSASTDVTVTPDTNHGTAATGLTNGTLRVGTLTASSNQVVLDVFVYLDGDDATVKSDNAVNTTDIIRSLTLNFAIPA